MQPHSGADDAPAQSESAKQKRSLRESRAVLHWQACALAGQLGARLTWSVGPNGERRYTVFDRGRPPRVVLGLIGESAGAVLDVLGAVADAHRAEGGESCRG